MDKDDQQRKELQDKVEQELRIRLGREKRFQAMMQKHEAEDKVRYKKLALNVAGLKEFTYDSYGNPITMRDKKPQPTDHEVVKPIAKLSKKPVPTVINSYYAPAFEKLLKMQAMAATLPPPVPRMTLHEKEKTSADSLI